MQSSDVSLSFDALPNRMLLRPQEVAVFMNVSSRTIYRWYEIGIIQGTRLNRSVRIFRDSVVNWIEAQKNE
jgi:excisionase family DNA binding protein